MYRSATTSPSKSSEESAGRSRAAFSASSRSHTASVVPLFSAAVSTSRSSSGVILVAMVLVRKPDFSWGLSAELEVAGIVVRDMLMGEPAYIQDAPHQNPGQVERRSVSWKRAFRFSMFTDLRGLLMPMRTSVYARNDILEQINVSKDVNQRKQIAWFTVPIW